MLTAIYYAPTFIQLFGKNKNSKIIEGEIGED